MSRECGGISDLIIVLVDFNHVTYLLLHELCIKVSMLHGGAPKSPHA